MFCLWQKHPRLKILPHPVIQDDEDRNRGAHSCGAVAGFHRLPEHPGDCFGEMRCINKKAAGVSWNRFP
jgi:hypothetical protein